MSTRRTRWTAKELMAVEFPEIRWVVPGIIPDGLTMFSGAPKLGKSAFAMNLGLATASGGYALGRIPVEQGDVFYLALEDPGRRLQDRMGRLLIAQQITAPEALTFETLSPRLDEGGDDLVRCWIDEHDAARLVIVDILARMRPNTAPNRNRYDADYDTISRFKQIADDTRVAHLLLHHDKKGPEQDFLDRVSGTHGLGGAADTVIVAERARHSADAIISVVGRDVAEIEYAMRFHAADGIWELLDEPASDYRLSESRLRIVEVLRQDEGLTPKDIAERLNLNVNNVNQTLRRMVVDDQVDTDGEGHYFPVPVRPVRPTPQPLRRNDPGLTVGVSDPVRPVRPSDTCDRSDSSDCSDWSDRGGESDADADPHIF